MTNIEMFYKDNLIHSCPKMQPGYDVVLLKIGGDCPFCGEKLVPDKMTEGQESHLQEIKRLFEELVDAKYRKGQKEHGGDLFSKTSLDLVNMAIDEAIDQVVYLLTLKSTLLPNNQSNEGNS